MFVYRTQPFSAVRKFARVGIMTVQTAHRAALQKYNEADARSVARAERFERMNITFQLASPPFRFLSPATPW